MKPVKFLIAFTFYLNCFGQINSNFEENFYPEPVVEFQNELNKIIQGKPRILVPFQKDEKWGYMDYHTKEILVSPRATWLNVFRSNVENTEVGMFRMNEESYNIILKNSKVTTLKIGPPIKYVNGTSQRLEATCIIQFENH
jgi:hypothetical protein